MAVNSFEARHRILRDLEAEGRDARRADDLMLHAPAVHTPRTGRAVTRMDLGAALQVLGAGPLRYLRQIVVPRDAALQFEAEGDGLVVDGVVPLRWNDDGRLVEFRVPIRPPKANDRIRRRSAAALQAASAR